MSEENTNKGLDNFEYDLLFARAEVIRLMKDHLSRDKQITERVKVEMNRFLGNILISVCEELDKYPYTTIDYEMLKEATYPYTNIKKINQERENLLVHLNAIKSDCDVMAMDIEKTLKLNDRIDDENKYVPFTSEPQEMD